ncbi:MAG: hypothetical protein NXY57DRAFT_987714 [Lentinula lateritia]|nr:MAG: hypothetical protein NXY57DRAFT_987714 [Lentinula lateritia]
MPPRVNSRMVHAKPKPTPNPSTQKISNKSSKGKPPKIQSDTSSNGKTSSYSQATANPNIHRERAKRWGTNPFMAEWFANAVEYMKAPKAQLDFEDWVFKSHPEEEAHRILRQCKLPPVQRVGTSTGNRKMYNNAAVELGVSDEAMIQYHNFTAENLLVEPARVKPAAIRRRGEPSSKWLVRRMESLLNGCQIADVDWEEIQRIAISQIDETAYTYEIWHIDSEYLIEGLKERARSTVPAPGEIGNMHEPYMRDLQLRSDAYRSRLHLIHIAHAHWTLAVSLFEELELRGLRKTSAIEAAYKADPRLKWRLAGLAAMTATYASKISSRTNQVLAALPAFSKYFKRHRDNQGVLKIEVDYTYIRAHPYPRNSIDEIIVKVCGAHGSALNFVLTQIKDHLRKFPKEALKFDDVAWREIGEYLVVTHFFQEFCASHFGRRLQEAASESKQLSPSSPQLDIVFEEVSFMSRSSLSKYIPPHHDHAFWHFGRCRSIVEAMVDVWAHAIFDPGLTGPDIVRCYMWMHHSPEYAGFRAQQRPGFDEGEEFNAFFDKTWYDADKWCWERAGELDPPDGRKEKGKGAVARMFGLYDVQDNTRPSWWNFKILMKIARELEDSSLVEKEKVESTAKPGSAVSVIPVSTGPRDTAVHSGHAYAAGNVGTDATKDKVKTRPSVMVVDEPEGPEGGKGSKDPTSGDEKGEEVEEYLIPEFLPKQFKLPKKVHKTFQRILENDDNPNLAPDAPKKGQVRWDDFEKAMKRVGFDIVQTAGSSVRFDPPAKTARPITFHRPHPDSLLTPFMIKWIGGRLNRCYGWTTATFLVAPSLDGDVE